MSDHPDKSSIISKLLIVSWLILLFACLLGLWQMLSQPTNRPVSPKLSTSIPSTAEPGNGHVDLSNRAHRFTETESRFIRDLQDQIPEAVLATQPSTLKPDVTIQMKLPEKRIHIQSTNESQTTLYKQAVTSALARNPLPKGIYNLNFHQNGDPIAGYIATLQVRIKYHWKPPSQTVKQRVVARYTLDREGRLLGLRLDQSSGEKAMDESALQAVRDSAPFPPAPPKIEGRNVDIQFIFDYNTIPQKSDKPPTR